LIEELNRSPTVGGAEEERKRKRQKQKDY